MRTIMPKRPRNKLLRVNPSLGIAPFSVTCERSSVLFSKDAVWTFDIRATREKSSFIGVEFS